MSNTITKEYAIAYKEVVCILDFVPKEYIDKIPKEKIEFYKENMNNDYEYHIDFSKDFQEQEMTNETAAILANLFYDYWANEEQKAAIKHHENQEYAREEASKREKYNVNVFLNEDMESNKESRDSISDDTNKSLVEPKDSIFTKIINKIKAIFKIK